jgi:hypothetical protein
MLDDPVVRAYLNLQDKLLEIDENASPLLCSQHDNNRRAASAKTIRPVDRLSPKIEPRFMKKQEIVKKLMKSKIKRFSGKK